MSLSSAQQNKIVQLLGYGGKTLDSGSVIYDKVLADRLLNLNTDTEELVDIYLANIAALEKQIACAPSRLTAEKVDGITLNLHELEMLRTERKRQVKELASLLDIPYIGANGVNVSVRC